MIARRLIESPAERARPPRVHRPAHWRMTPVIELPGLLMSIDADRDRAVVTLNGDLDIASSGLLVQWLFALMAVGRTGIVVDLGGLEFCDASGLGSLVKISVRAARFGGWLRLAAVSPQTGRILGITHLVRALPVYATVEDALAGIDRTRRANGAVTVTRPT